MDWVVVISIRDEKDPAIKTLLRRISATTSLITASKRGINKISDRNIIIPNPNSITSIIRWLASIHETNISLGCPLKPSNFMVLSVMSGLVLSTSLESDYS